MNTIYAQLSTAQIKAKEYAQKIPKNTPQLMALSGGYVFVIFLVRGHPLDFAAKVSFCAASAAGIHGLVSPLFRRFAKFDRTLTWQATVARSSIAALGARCVAYSLGIGSSFLPVWVSLVVNSVLDLFLNRRNVNKAFPVLF